MRFTAGLAATTALLMGGVFSLGAAIHLSRAEDKAPSEPARRPETGERPNRVAEGLVALYDFASADGPIVEDRASSETRRDLQIRDMDAVRRSPGSLQVLRPTRIESHESTTGLSRRLARSNALTIEAWIRPSRIEQSGPARIVTLSKNASERNFTLGQDGDRIDFRLRTTRTGTNGIPSLATPAASLQIRPTHVVYTRGRSGRARIYIDGKPAAEREIPGSLSSWNPAFRLALGDELSGDRPWLGTYYLVAVYARDLSAAEVAQNFRAGARATTARLAGDSEREQREQFERKIAPLLAAHCLECHDAPTRRGGLDLSRKAPALAGGDNGPVIVPGKPDASRLWQVVASDEMPAERTPLSSEEKELLRRWLEAGAAWPIDFIDPAIYAHDQRAAQLWVQRLTVPEYIETVRSAVGVDIAEDARELLPADLRADGFRNTAYNLSVDLKHVDAYAKLAEIIVRRMDVNAFAARFTRSRKLTDDNMRPLVADMGKWLLRGPLTEREVVTYRGISTTVAAAGGDFKDAVAYTIEAMLQSPRFIYRIENQRGDGSAWPVGEYELASRLSYIIWGGPPDQELMKAAEAGRLSDAEFAESQVHRMLRDPRAVQRSKQFLTQWLHLERLEHLAPSARKFPDWDPALAEDMRRETLAYFEDVVWKQQRPLSDLLNAQVTYATPRLAKHYRLAPQAKDFSRYDLSSVPGRGGLLTQGSVLTVGGDEASMVTRGLFVLHDLLRGTVKDPPPCVDTTPVPTRSGLTQRGIAEARIANEACGGCHARFEPLAFGLEKFDGLGSYHEKDEHGNTLREDGRIWFPGTDKPVSYRTSAELMDLLAESPRVRESLTWKVVQFSLGRPLTAADAASVREIHEAAQRTGGTWQDLITALVMSDLVRKTRTEIDR